VTPTLAGYSFTPSSRTYSNVLSAQINQDYVGANTFTISGYVRNPSGIGISGVDMGGVPPQENHFTDANGFYSVTVAYGWSGTVIPAKSGYVFSPPSRTYSNVTSNQSNQDYVGTPPQTFTISGHVYNTNGTTPFSGVQITGFPSGAVMTDSNGFYSATVPYGWSGSIQLCYPPGGGGICFYGDSKTFTNVTSDLTRNFHAVQSLVPCLCQQVQTYVISGQVTLYGLVLSPFVDKIAEAVGMGGVVMNGLPGSSPR
jgi:hypothetical protein